MKPCKILEEICHLAVFFRVVHISVNIAFERLIGISDVATDFVKYYDDIKYCRVEGDETYLLIPKYENSVVTIHSVDSDGNRINKDFSEVAKAVVITCNLSDIIPNIEVTVEYTNENGEKGSISFNPSISLMDGSISDFEKGFEF